MTEVKKRMNADECERWISKMSNTAQALQLPGSVREKVQRALAESTAEPMRPDSLDSVAGVQGAHKAGH